MAEIFIKTENNKKDAFEIRTKVFMEEQGYENEFDEIDDYCKYATVYYDKTPVGTGRVFPKTDDENVCIFGRIAVLKEYRKLHLGKIIIETLEKIAKESGYKKVILLSQESAIGFYKKCDFVLCDSDVVYDEGHPHYWMEKYL